MEMNPFDNNYMHYEALVDLIQDGLVMVNHPRDEIEEWRLGNGIECSFLGMYRSDDLWYVPDSQQRVEFSLRWM